MNKDENVMDLLLLSGYEKVGFKFIEQMVFYYLNSENGFWVLIDMFSNPLIREKIVEEDKPKFNALLKEYLKKIENKLVIPYGEELEK